MYLYYFKRIQFFYCVNLMMYFYLFLILALIYFIYFRFTIETFITENINGELTPDSKYLIDTTQLSQKKQLLFLDKINNLMKKSKQNIDKGKCIDAQGTLPTQNPSVRQGIDLKNSFNELEKNIVNDKFKKDSCISISSELCEYTNPYLYLPETINTPPAYLLKSFKDITLPKNVDLNCFNTFFNCCKNSKIP